MLLKLQLTYSALLSLVVGFELLNCLKIRYIKAACFCRENPYVHFFVSSWLKKKSETKNPVLYERTLFLLLILSELKRGE